jgi:hypothetical protein
MSVEIIVKKVQNIIGVHAPSKLCFGDLQSQLSRDLLKSLTAVVEKKAGHPRPYFILVHTNIDRMRRGGQGIKETIMLMDQLPSYKLLGTLAFRIDNQRGDAEMVWCLPLDIPAPAFLGVEKAKNGRVFEDAKGLPIINRRIA